MDAARVGSTGLDRPSTGRPKRERCGPDRGRKGIRQGGQADPGQEGEAVRHGDSISSQSKGQHTVVQQGRTY
eukprot:14413096-Heterocapsa_arctica.AAC.1